jgi:hypothetical protein
MFSRPQFFSQLLLLLDLEHNIIGKAMLIAVKIVSYLSVILYGEYKNIMSHIRFFNLKVYGSVMKIH